MSAEDDGKPYTDRDGLFCVSRIRTTNDDLGCAKRPHTFGPHVGIRADGSGSVRWWGGDEDDVRDEVALLGGPILDAALRPVKPSGPSPLRPTSKAARSIDARGQGFTGDECGKCGSMRIIKTGSCGTCSDCGEPGGCS